MAWASINLELLGVYGITVAILLFWIQRQRKDFREDIHQSRVDLKEERDAFHRSNERNLEVLRGLEKALALILAKLQ